MQNKSQQNAKAAIVDGQYVPGTVLSFVNHHFTAVADDGQTLVMKDTVSGAQSKVPDRASVTPLTKEELTALALEGRAVGAMGLAALGEPTQWPPAGDKAVNPIPEVEPLVAAAGWAVPATCDANPARAAWTVGLHQQDFPELVVLGLPMRVAGHIINEIAYNLLNMRDAGKFEPGKAQALTLERYPYPFYYLPVNRDRASQIAYSAHVRSGGEAVYAQIVLADKFGKFPWEAGHDSKGMQYSPSLGAGEPAEFTPMRQVDGEWTIDGGVFIPVVAGPRGPSLN